MLVLILWFAIAGAISGFAKPGNRFPAFCAWLVLIPFIFFMFVAANNVAT